MKTSANPPSRERVPAVTEASDISPLLTLQNLINQDFERFFSRFGISAPTSGSPSFANLNPSVNVTERENVLHVEAELPGLAGKDVEVSLDDNVLTIQGQRRQESERKDSQIHRREIRYGSFRRSIALPGEGDADQAQASLKDGILLVSIPVSPRPRGAKRRIPVVNR